MVLTTTFLNQMITEVKTDIAALFTHGAIGTGTTPVAVGDTTLETEVFRDTLDDVDTSGPARVVSSLRVFTTEANGNIITENGVLDAASGGNLWTHNLTAAIIKTSDIQMFLDTQINIAVTETS